MQVNGCKVPVSEETIAVPAVKEAAADYRVTKAITPLLFGSDAVGNNNKSWFQSRSG